VTHLLPGSLEFGESSPFGGLVQGSPVISAMLNGSAPFIVQNLQGMEWIGLSLSKIAWIIVQKSPDYCSI